VNCDYSLGCIVTPIESQLRGGIFSLLKLANSGERVLEAYTVEHGRRDVRAE
jgi:hypothetical protein